jgi:hypothetical protein
MTGFRIQTLCINSGNGRDRTCQAVVAHGLVEPILILILIILILIISSSSSLLLLPPMTVSDLPGGVQELGRGEEHGLVEPIIIILILILILLIILIIIIMSLPPLSTHDSIEPARRGPGAGPW